MKFRRVASLEWFAMIHLTVSGHRVSGFILEQEFAQASPTGQLYMQTKQTMVEIVGAFGFFEYED